MNHGKKFNHLKRARSHRVALLSNMSKSLILRKRIFTTLAKAKALRKYIEPILNKTKQDTTHSRRIIFSYFQDKVVVKELFGVISTKIAERPGGYTRIIKITQRRLNDGAEMCYIELVDFNEIFTKKKTKQKSKTRRGSKKSINSITAYSEPQTPKSTKSEKIESSLKNKNIEENVTKPEVEEQKLGKEKKANQILEKDKNLKSK